MESIIDNLDYLLDLIPELKYMIGFDHKNPHHHLDVWNHTLYALSLSENDFELRLCLLLHDIGKPHSYQEGEIRHYNGHALKSSIMSKGILTRLGYKEEFIDEVCYLIRYHDTPITKKDIENNYELSVKRYKIQICDAMAHNPEKLEKRIKYLNKVKENIKNYDWNRNNKYV
jgi:tRNA nucleotidyltransferase (CCA-adding enzyme)